MRKTISLILFSAGLMLLAGCSDNDRPNPSTPSSENSGGGGNSGGEAQRGELVIDDITVDASSVQGFIEPLSAGNTNTGPVTGLLGYIQGSQPTRLVVMCHGYGHNVQDSWTQHVVSTVREDTAVVTTNYRDNERFPVLRGAHDTIAATLRALQEFPTIETVYMFGISLGGAVSGTAIVESSKVTLDGSLLYDYWITVEGVSNLSQTHSEATFAANTLDNETAQQAIPDIEDEAGGTPMEVPDEYQRRSPALNTATMAMGGLRAVAVIHATWDGTVPYPHGRQMAQAASGSNIPTQFFTVGRVAEGEDPGTVLPNAPPDFAGHGSEADPTHTVIRTGFEQLELMLDGLYDETIPYMEHTVDDQMG